MKQENVIFIVTYRGTSFLVNPHSKIIPILWCQDGEYRVFPKEVLANAIDIIGLHRGHYSEKTTIQPAYVWWEQGIPVDNLVGRALSGE